MQRVSLIVRSVWAACLLVACANHVRILWRHGLLWDYGGAHWASALYWSSLTVIDPIVAFLLFARPKPGIMGTIALITTNVAHNLTVMALSVPEGEFLAHAASDPFIASQVMFMAFVVGTAHLAWKGVGSGSARFAEKLGPPRV